MVVIRPEGLQIIDVDIEFNLLNYSKLEIDLQHINRGKWLTRETSFLLGEILNLVTNFLDGELIEADAQKVYENESCDYYCLSKNYRGKTYKLVFCICTDKKETLGIITLHRSRR